MNTKLSLSVILPIKSSKARNFDEYFEKAITSIKTQSVGIQELVIVHSSEESLVNFLNEYDFESLKWLVEYIGFIDVKRTLYADGTPDNLLELEPMDPVKIMETLCIECRKPG